MKLIQYIKVDEDLFIKLLLPDGNYRVFKKPEFKVRFSDFCVVTDCWVGTVVSSKGKVVPARWKLDGSNTIKGKYSLEVLPKGTANSLLAGSSFNNLIGRTKRKLHTQHYIKFEIGKDKSIRYYYKFDDRPNLIGKWAVTQDCKPKKFTEITVEDVRKFYDARTSEVTETIGVAIGRKYSKLVQHHDFSVEHIVE